jgi:hypothetical protein
MIELIRLRNMPVQGGRVELSQQEDPHQAGVDAIGNWYIDQPILPAERHSRLGAVFGERKQPRALTASKNNCQDVMRAKRQEWLRRLHGKPV